MPGIPENGCGDILMQTKVLPPFRLVNPEMFATFVMVSFQKSPTNISNDMTKNLILAAAMLLAGGAVAAQSQGNRTPRLLDSPRIGAELDRFVHESRRRRCLRLGNRRMAHRRRQTDRQPRPHLQRHGRQHGESHRQGDHGHRAAQRREHPHVRRLPETRRLETRHAPDSRNEVSFGLQPRRPRRQKDRQAAQEIRRAGPDGDHRLLDQRLHGIQEAHSRHQNLLPQRRPGSQEHQETGAGRASTTR